MPRIRSIKPEFFTDDDVAELPPLVRILFIGLWCHADKAGRLKDKPKTIRVVCVPFDKIDVNSALNTLADANFIYRYSVEGVDIIQIRTWEQHQRPHHTEKDSVLAPFNNGSCTVRERSGPSPMTRNKKQEPASSGPPGKPSLFTPPSVKEVSEYKPDIDAEAFVDHYKSNGWKVGKNPMKDWKAAARGWVNRQGSFEDAKQKSKPQSRVLDEDDPRWTNYTGQ